MNPLILVGVAISLFGLLTDISKRNKTDPANAKTGSGAHVDRQENSDFLPGGGTSNGDSSGPATAPEPVDALLDQQKPQLPGEPNQ